MPNIQCHLSWETLEIYHLAALHIAVTHCVCQAFRFRQSLPLQILIADCCRIPFPSFQTYVIALRIRFSCICSTKPLQMKWDNGRGLSLIPGEDSFHVVQQKQEVQRIKPDCPLIGQNGNIFNLMGIASRTLKENSMAEEAKEMCDKIMQSGSYEEAMCILGEYVNITSINEEMDECKKYEEELEEPDMGMNMSF